jgi:hypothetical protein
LIVPASPSTSKRRHAVLTASCVEIGPSSFKAFGGHAQTGTRRGKLHFTR